MSAVAEMIDPHWTPDRTGPSGSGDLFLAKEFMAWFTSYMVISWSSVCFSSSVKKGRLTLLKKICSDSGYHHCQTCRGFCKIL